MKTEDSKTEQVSDHPLAYDAHAADSDPSVTILQNTALNESLERPIR